MSAFYVKGNPLMVQHTPGADIAAGEMVVIGNEVRIAHHAIKSGEVGNLAIPNGSCEYEVSKDSAGAINFADGDEVWLDAASPTEATNTSNAGANKHLGTAVARGRQRRLVGPDRARQDDAVIVMSQLLWEAEQERVSQIQQDGYDVVIVSPDTTQTPVKANIGKTEFEHLDAGNVLITTRTTDFLIVIADLPEAITKSHRIQFNGETYQPSTPNGEPFTRDSGRFGLVTRIHAMKVYA